MPLKLWAGTTLASGTVSVIDNTIIQYIENIFYKLQPRTQDHLRICRKDSGQKNSETIFRDINLNSFDFRMPKWTSLCYHWSTNVVNL